MQNLSARDNILVSEAFWFPFGCMQVNSHDESKNMPFSFLLAKNLSFCILRFWIIDNFLISVIRYADISDIGLWINCCHRRGKIWFLWTKTIISFPDLNPVVIVFNLYEPNCRSCRSENIRNHQMLWNTGTNSVLPTGNQIKTKQHQTAFCHLVWRTCWRLDVCCPANHQVLT